MINVLHVNIILFLTSWIHSFIYFLILGDCRNLQDLNISNCANVSDEVIKEITVGCPSLLYVNMSRTEISDASLRYLSRYVSLCILTNEYVCCHRGCDWRNRSLCDNVRYIFFYVLSIKILHTFILNPPVFKLYLTDIFPLHRVPQDVVKCTKWIDRFITC